MDDGNESSDADIVTSGAAAPAAPDGEEDVADAAVVVRRRRRVPRPRAPMVVQVLVFLVIDMNMNCPSELQDIWARGTADSPRYEAGSDLRIAGVASVSAHMVPCVDDCSEHASIFHKFADRAGVATVAYLDYIVNEVYKLDGEPYYLHDRDELADGELAALTLRRVLRGRTFGGRQLISRFADGRQTTTLFAISQTITEMFILSMTTLALSLAFGQRLRRTCSLPSFPTVVTIRKWMSIIRSSDRPGQQCNVAPPPIQRKRRLFHLPPRAKRARTARSSGPDQLRTYHDPVQTLKVLRFSRRIKDLRFVQPALEEAADVLIADEEQLGNVLDNAPTNAKRSSLLEARRRLDATSMCLERREAEYWALEAPELVESAHLFSDASPVTGTELQGMVLVIVLASGLVIQRVLPGVALWYGYGRLVDKAIALLWALFLVCGPREVVIRFMFEKIKSVTTDMGTELGFADVPDLLSAFLKHMNGASLLSLSGCVDGGSRLMKNALTISGWGNFSAIS